MASFIEKAKNEANMDLNRVHVTNLVVEFSHNLAHPAGQQGAVMLHALVHPVADSLVPPPCRDDGLVGHVFAERTCPYCGAIFCHNCCGGSNRDQGGKHEPDWTACPACGYDCDA